MAASEDARIDVLHERAEKDIVSGGQSRKFLIGSCAPLVAKVARNFSLLQEVFNNNLIDSHLIF